jgi:nijmegen breakage syndrome protein 1
VFDRDHTTHVVAKKRNTPKGLQALIGGKYIVLDSFVDALVAAATRVEGESAPLENDFEAHFPNSLEYLPPKGLEPTQRHESAYAPDSARQDMFAGYTFVFYNKTQYDGLSRPIQEGGGKAMSREAIPDETTVEDFVRYVKGVAGEKGLGEFEDGSEGKGVVVVKFSPVEGPGTEWYANFGINIALYLDHRLIEQNEFLDAILGNDASVLRRPLEIDSSGVAAPPPTAGTSISLPWVLMLIKIATNASFQAPPSSAPVAPSQPATQASEMAPPTRRGRSRRTGKKFIGFDDDDFSSMAPSSAPESMVVDPAPVLEYSQGLFVSQDPDMDIDRPASQASDTQRLGSSKRKRNEPIFEEEEEENLVDQIAPVQAALRRRHEERGESSAPAVPKPEPRQPPAKKVKKELKEIDVVEINRQKHEEAKALAEAERESLLQQLEGMDIEQMRNLAIIEEVPVVRKPPPIRTARADESDRWDDKWNGRKDFKRFRRRGADGNGRIERVLVPLEEARTKDFGIGDEYWGENDTQKKKKDKGKGKDTQDLDTQMDFNSGGRSTGASRSTGGSAPKSRAVNRARHILEGEDEFSDSEFGPEPEQSKAVSSDVEIVSPPPKPVAKKPAAKATTTRGSRSQKPVPSQESSATQGRSTSGSKRAAESAPKAPPAKKQRQLGLKKKKSEDEDEDSDDDLKFKFRRR